MYRGHHELWSTDTSPKCRVSRRRRTEHTNGYHSGATRCPLPSPSSDTLDAGDAWLDAAQQVGTRIQTRPNQLFYYLFKKGLPKTKTVSARLLLAASEPPLLLAASLLSWIFTCWRILPCVVALPAAVCIGACIVILVSLCPFSTSVLLVLLVFWMNVTLASESLQDQWWWC